MTDDIPQVVGDQSREAIDALGGYIYQLYQSALAWSELKDDQLLFLEVAEDYAVLASGVLTAVQVKRTAGNITINSEGVAKAIDSLFQLSKANSRAEVHVRFLTTSNIGLERKSEDRVAGGPALEAWRSLAKSGDPSQLRAVLARSGIASGTKKAIADLTDADFRSQVLRRIHFDCGEPGGEVLRRELSNNLGRILQANGGLPSQLAALEALVLRKLLETSATRGDRITTALEFRKLIEKVTRVSIRQADLDRLMDRALGTAAGTVVSVSDRSRLRAVPPLPSIRIARKNLTDRAHGVLETNGVLWLNAATGMGKTVMARMVANRTGGFWAGMSLRDFNEAQTASTLENITEELATSGLTGVVLDDVGSLKAQDAQNALQQLIVTADRLDIPLIFTASAALPSKVSFALGTAETISVSVPDFDETEISELIAAHGGDPTPWTRYVYMCAGGGHPQLSEALVRNLRLRGWPVEDLATLQGILEGDPAVEEVRAECRSRLLRELDTGSLAVLERLSLYAGSFDRGLVLALAALPPPVAYAGLLLDELVGPWIDQVDTKHFQLSPLVAGLGQKSLNANEQREVLFAIADHLTRGPALDVGVISTATLAALGSRNARAMLKLTMAIVASSEGDLALMSKGVLAFSYLKTDAPIWPENGRLNMLMRGSQLLLAKGGENYDKIPAIFEAFQSETDQLSDDPATHALETLVYVKILASITGVKKAIPHFEKMLARLAALLPGTGKLLEEEGKVGTDFMRPGGVTVLGLAFFSQIQGVTTLDELPEKFAFVSACSIEVRADILQPLTRPEFDADMLVRGAWLAEHLAGSIRPDDHAELLLGLEKESAAWGVSSIPIACRKFAAVIKDEYGHDKDGALAVINEGLAKYGETNSELVRAKAKIYYRAGDHTGSLNLSRLLIERNEIGSSVERAFLGRDAAISAETQGDLTTARAYYLYAREAAQDSSVPDMKPMAVGLGADAALAAWQAGDRGTCLREFATFFSELQTIDPKSSLRAAHCRAVGHHVLLWLDQDATGELRDIGTGEPAQIYPGCVSNPEPHKDIGQHPITPIEMGWYMLAKVECESGVNVGIADAIEDYLPTGPYIDGECVLIPALLGRALRTVDATAFFSALQAQLAVFAFLSAHGGARSSFNVLNPTSGRIPPLDPAVAAEFESIAQLYVLAFLGACVFEQNPSAFRALLKMFGEGGTLPTDADFISVVLTGVGGDGFNSQLAQLVHAAVKQVEEGEKLTPTQNWMISFDVIQVADGIGEFRTLAPKASAWVTRTWEAALSEQRFLLVTPNLHESEIVDALATEAGPVANLFLLLKVTLGATRVTNQPSALKLLSSIEAKYV